MKMARLFVAAFILVEIYLTLAAPSINQNTKAQLDEQMKNLNNEFKLLGGQFQSMFNNIEQGKKQFSTVNSKREITSEEQEKKDKKKMYDELARVSKELKDLHKNIDQLREKVNNMKESLDVDSESDDSDIDRRGFHALKETSDHPECIQKSIVEETDPLILKIALAITKKISANDKRSFIERVVNKTANDIVKKMKASHGVANFHKRLLKTVLQLLKVRSILTIKTEGKFIDQLSKRTMAKTSGKPSGQLDVSKVLKSLEDLLKQPVAKGFVSKKEEKKMVEKAIKAVGKDLDLSLSKIEAAVRVMTERIEKQIKQEANHSSSDVETKNKKLSDQEKISGLGKMISSKAIEKDLDKNEMHLLVKGLTAAVAARNKLSEKRKHEIEDKITKQAEESFPKTDKAAVKKEKADSEFAKNMIQKYKDIPAGFKNAYMKKYASDKMNFQNTRNKTSDAAVKRSNLGELERRTILQKLEELEAMATKIGAPVLPSALPSSREDLGDKGDQVIIDAATNTRGSTRIVEHHNGKRDVNAVSKNYDDELVSDVQQLVDKLEQNVLQFKQRISKYSHSPNRENKTHEKVVLDVAKGTMGARKLVEGYKRKRNLAESIGKLIKLVKTMIPEQKETDNPLDRDRVSKTTAKTNQVEPPTTPSTPTDEAESVVESDAEDKNAVQEISKKADIPVDYLAEIEKAEAKIQKDMEKQQRREEKNKEGHKQSEEAKEKTQQLKEQAEEKKEQAKEKLEQEKERVEQELEEVEEKKQEKEIKIKPTASDAKVDKEVDEIEKELNIHSDDQTNLLDKLKSLSKNKKATTKADQDDMIKELDALFDKS